MPEPKVPDVDGTPESRAEANSLKIRRLEQDITESLQRVEDALNELHRRIDHNEDRLRQVELYQGELNVRDRDE